MVHLRTSQHGVGGVAAGRSVVVEPLFIAPLQGASLSTGFSPA
jgi:hypothetical protein